LQGTARHFVNRVDEKSTGVSIKKNVETRLTIVAMPTVLLEYILLTVLLLVVVNAFVRSFWEKRQLLQIFGQYAPPEVVAAVSGQPREISLAGEEKEMTVLFSDIKNFTGISEQLDPGQLTEMLNAYFSAMTDILHRHGATIDKYMGDAIMAFWGAPVAQPDHARRALAAAIEIQAALVGLRREFRNKGWPEFWVGIGINTGVMRVGNLGSKFRVSYTVIGEPVNLAFHLERFTRSLNTPIIVSESTRRAAPEMSFRDLGPVEVKGRHDAVRIYEPVMS
jgi:adenylate cyclase